MNPLILDASPEYQAKLARAAEALEALDPHKRMGSRCFAAANRMGNTSSVIFPFFRDNPETGKRQVLLQLRPDGEVWAGCWGLPASALNADESKLEVIVRMLRALGCELKQAVPLHGAEWYMSTTEGAFPDEHLSDPRNMRGSYYHYPYYVEAAGEPIAGQRGWEWWDVDALPDESTWVVHHIRGALFPVLQYLENRAVYDNAMREMLAALNM